MTNNSLTDIMEFEDLINLMGFDIESKNYVQWKDHTEKTGMQMVRQKISINNPLLKELGINSDWIDDNGIYYLNKSTHFLKYVSSRSAIKKHKEDLQLILSIAVFFSEGDISIQPSEESVNILLLEGTNIVLSNDENKIWPKIDFLGSRRQLKINGNDISISDFSGKSRLIANKFEFDYSASLPFDGNFITLFKEIAPIGKEEAIVEIVLDDKTLSQEWLILKKVKHELHKNWKAAWEVIKDNVLYINWSDVASSGTDAREYRGAIRLNPRFDLPITIERLAWVSSSLYHEAKHQQFQTTFEFEYTPDDESSISPLKILGQLSPQIVCAWRGYPSSRSLPDHLFALHAFIPGLIMNYEIMSRGEKLSEWSKDHIEMDMRGINGAISAIVLGQRFLTNYGQTLSDVLRRDYAVHLVPTFTKMITWPKTAENYQ